MDTGSSPRVRGTHHCQLAAARRRSVHPRVCGERADVEAAHVCRNGSSPRVRGTRRRRRRAIAVHPRVCGELGSPAPAAVHGSSPRVRGTRVRSLQSSIDCRFIPACAGNAATRHRSARSRSVHPRVCGEQSTRRCRRCGSPVHPRVCGEQLRARRCGVDVVRFIPACAGNSHHADRRDSRCHGSSPRVRGTRSMVAGHLAADCGSSPRVRGTRRIDVRQASHRRFIPACAGNAQPLRLAATARLRFIPACAGNASDRRLRIARAHGSSPRVRGTRGSRARNAPANGSSPRVRGTASRAPLAYPRPRFIPACAGNAQSVRIEAHDRHRFIPACAGNASLDFRLAAAPTVHPRVCGERDRRFAARPWSRPVHPRVCGERGAHCDPGYVHSRFIPACAGNATFPAHRPCANVGSSPRVRGTRTVSGMHRVRLVSVHPRVCGERGHRARMAGASASVHPRVCGERSRCRLRPYRIPGSSPRVRGTLLRIARGDHEPSVHPRVCGERGDGSTAAPVGCRFIPACAGNASDDDDRDSNQRFIPACAGNACAARRG